MQEMWFHILQSKSYKVINTNTLRCNSGSKPLEL